ncbi:MAG: 4-hydroxy-tetrahydrodipicolinate synthase [Desulfobacterales bacterium]|nr:4-hydroxy-tetrahydrodipicolinate synthase [Desulfobacterales bacterium]
MKAGCTTALITPFRGEAVDRDGLDRLVEFQIANGITGILAVGTTGESPVLTWQEHNEVTERIAGLCRGRCLCIAGTGSNNTRETLEGTRHAAECGCQAVLLVDPYYNGPSSLEIRREYVGPVAKAFPALEVIPYVIPGRTGTQLLPEDLGILARRFANVAAVKEATGDIGNMRRTRECCGPDFAIFSGDDPLTVQMMSDPLIKASGVISVASNVAPGAVVKMVNLLLEGKPAEARSLAAKLEPLFGLVTVKTMEKTPYGEVACRARNPLAYKSLMAILGMPSGGCKPPLGKLTRNGLNTVLEAARSVQRTAPEILDPVAEFFGVNIAERLENPKHWEGLCYPEY